MRDLERLRQVTSNYYFWQGLRWAPLGLPMLYLGAEIERRWPAVEALRPLPLLAVVALACLGSWWAGRYYSRAYGQVTALAGAHRRREQLKWLLVYPAMFGAMLFDAFLKPPVFVTGLVWAAGILAYRQSTGGGRRHYVAAAALFASLAFLPPLGIVEPGVEAARIFLILLGATYVIGGLLDHRELAKLLPGPQGAAGTPEDTPDARAV